MAATINVNHTVNMGNISDFSTILESFTAKFEAIAQNISSPQSGKSSQSQEDKTPSNSNSSSFDVLTASNNQLSSSIKNNLTNLFVANTKKAEELSTAFNASINEYKTQKITSQELNKSLQELNKQLKPSNQGGFASNLMKGFMGLEWLEGLNKVAHIAAERGTIVGGQQQAINTGIMQSGDFMQNYQQALLQNTQQMYNTGRSTLLTTIGMGVGGVIGGALGSIVPIIGNAAGAVAGTAIGATAGSGVADVFNYSGNKQTQEQIANNQFRTQQDMSAWRMRNMLGFGSSSMGNININDKSYNTNLSDIQRSMINNQSMTAYAPYVSDYAFNANRQQMRQEKNNLPQNVKDITTAGQLMGISDQQMPQFINAVTTTAMTTGSTTNGILKQLLDVNAKYGGDTVKNTALTLQLMQTSHLGNYQQTQDLVNRYQYNQPALQNITNFSNLMPSDKWATAQIGRAMGLSEKEIQSGQLNPQDQARFLRDQHNATKRGTNQNLAWDKGIEMWFSGNQQNPNVNPMGIMAKNLTSKANIEAAQQQPSSAMQQFTDAVINSFQNIKLTTQTVHANTVNILGEIKGAVNTVENKVSQIYKQARSANSQGENSGSGGINIGDPGGQSVPPIIYVKSRKHNTDAAK